MVNASNSGLNYVQRYVVMPVFHSDWVKKGMNGEKELMGLGIGNLELVWKAFCLNAPLIPNS